MPENKKVLIISLILLILLLVGFTATYLLNRQDANVSQKQIVIKVEAPGQVSKEHIIKTESKYLGNALKESDIVQGNSLPYGFFITSVDGIKVSTIENGWWSITKNGEFLQTGVDETPINDGDRFELTLRST